MTIFSTPRLQREDMGAHEFGAGLSESLGASATEAVHEMPSAQLYDISELDSANGKRDDLGAQIGRVQAGESPADVMDNPTPIPRVDRATAQAKIKEAGLDKALTLPDGDIAAPALDIMMERARGRQERAATIARGPQGFVPSALSVGTSFLVGALDPVNVAAAFIPVVGELRFAKMMESAGESALARAGVRAKVGAASGAVGMAAIEPIAALAKTQEGRDYTFADALRSVIFGAALGGVLHTGFGAGADALRTRQEKPLFPYGAGEPMEFHTPFDELRQQPPGSLLPPQPENRLTGTFAEAAARADRAAEAPRAPEPEAVPAAAAEPVDPPTPSPTAAMLDDLPPRAKEDAMRASIAAITQGEPVRVGEMIEAGARHDPRIAEAMQTGIDAWHGSPHDFDRFDMEHLGKGEGAQAFGHGLYFAENEGVARDYQKNVIDKQYFDNVNKRLSEIAREMEPEKVHGSYDKFKSQKGRDLKAEYDRLLKERAGKTGAIYQVRINADREHFLDWDVALDNQPAGRKLLKDMEPGLREQLEDRLDDAGYSADLGALTGNELHQLLLKHVRDDYELPGVKLTESGNVKQEVAHYLLGKDIPGIKYLDQHSRPNAAAIAKLEQNVNIYKYELERQPNNKYAGERFEAAQRDLAEAIPKGEDATSNLVVFDHDIVEITHKNGEPVSRGERQEILHTQENNPKGVSAIEGPRAARGPRARDPETWSLNEFLAHRGGLDPSDPMIGDVRHLIGRSNKFVPGFGNLIRKGGMRLDKAREAAVEAGYLRDVPALEAQAESRPQSRPSYSTINDLLGAVDRELRGERVYRDGHERAPTAKELAHEAEAEMHQLHTEIDHIAREAGTDPVSLSPELRGRVIEIMHKEGVHDPEIAYERAVMEEIHNGAEAGTNERIPDHIPGWDVHDVGGPAPAAGRLAARQSDAQEPRTGGAQRSTGGADRQAPAPSQDETWRGLADTPRDFNDPDAVAASKAADALPEPASIQPSKRLQAAEKAEAEAQAQFDAAKDYLPPDLRERVEQELRVMEQDSLDTAEVVRRGAACLASGVVGAVA